MPHSMFYRFLFVFFGLYSAVQAQSATRTGDRARRAVTVSDAIEMTQIGDPLYFTKTNSCVQFSPDGTKFAFVVRKGNLNNDTVEFSLLVFRTAEALSSPHPEMVAKLASSSNREAIRHVQWLPDNETIVFMGEQPGQMPQLYKVSTRTKRLERLTSHPTLIEGYSVSESGSNFVYIAQAPPQHLLSERMLHRGFFVTTEHWDDLYTNRRSFNTRYEIFVKTPQMKTAQRAGGIINVNPQTAADISISPNGRYALLQAYRTNPPVLWDEYKYKADGETAPSADSCNEGEAILCPEQMIVVDLKRRTFEPLLNAPLTEQNTGVELATWTHQNSVLVVNALLPLNSTGTEERNQRLNHVYAAEIILPERKIIKISERQEPYSAFFIQANRARDRIVITTTLDTLGKPLEFRKENGKWTITEISETGREGDGRLSVTLEEGINLPPKLIANDPKTKRKAVLFDLNPQFSELTFGHVEVFSWKTRVGEWGEGTLYYPPDYIPGKRYPLIIQTHDERRDRFWVDGPYTTAYAAQPLANKGFMVLQMGMVDIYEKSSVHDFYNFFGTSKEGAHYTALFESAIDELDRRGVIDPARVGLTGFSRTAYHVLYALTHSQYHFAAAVVADGVNFGYVSCSYLMFDFRAVCERINGGLPFSDGLTHWAKTSPTSRMDKIEAPLLLQAISAPLEEWEIFAGLKWLKKPVEMINFYPQGAHQLVRPQQRLLSQGSVVDWYCFWLKSEEDSDPAKAIQYARWRKMREQRNRESAEEAP